MARRLRFELRLTGLESVVLAVELSTHGEQGVS